MAPASVAAESDAVVRVDRCTHVGCVRSLLVSHPNAGKPPRSLRVPPPKCRFAFRGRLAAPPKPQPGPVRTWFAGRPDDRSTPPAFQPPFPRTPRCRLRPLGPLARAHRPDRPRDVRVASPVPVCRIVARPRAVAVTASRNPHTEQPKLTAPQRVPARRRPRDRSKSAAADVARQPCRGGSSEISESGGAGRAEPDPAAATPDRRQPAATNSPTRCHPHAQCRY